MSLAGDILTAGEALLYATHSTEAVTIAGTTYNGFVMESTPGSDLDLGGFTDQSLRRIAIPRVQVSSIPAEGAAVTFRSVSGLTVFRVQDDDAEAPIVVEFGSPTSKRAS